MLSIIIAILFSISYVQSQRIIETPTLSVRQVNEDGFGDVNNNYAFSMIEFKENVYVATLNAVTFPGMLSFFFGLPFQTDGTQIWRGSKSGGGGGQGGGGDGRGRWSWDLMVNEGNGNQDNYGIRKFEVVEDYIYAVTCNHVSGFEIWQSSDGENWDVIDDGGVLNDGDTDNLSGRGLFAFKGYLYIGVENRVTGAKIIRRELTDLGDLVDGDWEIITDNGLDEPENWWFTDFVVYEAEDEKGDLVEYMYAGTLNMGGAQLWRTVDGEKYEKVFDLGSNDINNMAIMDLTVYDSKLYVGTMNFFDGAQLFSNKDRKGLDFELLFDKGNGNSQNAYVWYMCEYNDRLYVATFKTEGEFDLFSAEEPAADIEWTIETDDAFGNQFHYGVRSMIVYQDTMLIGSATARGPEATQIYECTAKTVEEILEEFEEEEEEEEETGEGN